jgi:hypothetical protein
MKHSFCITLEFAHSPYVRNIEFYGSRLQADRVFYALSFALPLSDCEKVILFQNDTEISRTTFNHQKKVGKR